MPESSISPEEDCEYLESVATASAVLAGAPSLLGQFDALSPPEPNPSDVLEANRFSKGDESCQKKKH